MPDLKDDPAVVFPLLRATPFTPPAVYHAMLETGPVSRVTLPDGSPGWAITRHEDVRKAFTDPRFSSDRTHPRFPPLTAESGQAPRTPYLLGMDPPVHGAARRAVVGEFTVRRLEALRPRVQRIVDEHIDALLGAPQPADLVEALALPVPSLVICEMLGVPYDDHAFFQSRSGTLLRASDTAEQRSTAADELRAYLVDLVTAKMAAPGDDLLGRQIEKQRADGAVDPESLIGLAFILLIAGHETTANMISLGTVAFLEHPDQLTAIRDDPTKTLNAIEELLRVFTIADTVTGRVTTEDVEIGGTRIPAGEPVVMLGNAANHDPEAFADPDRIDVERGARNHVAFGYGIHQCLGQNLARIELQVVFDTLFRRVPALGLARPVAELPFKDDGTVYGLYELPVTW